MIALWLEEKRTSIKDNLSIPQISAGEALVRITLAGICSTDLELARGYYPFKGVIGHEFVGIVEDVAGDSALVGKRVVGEINIYCNECDLCHEGLTSHCRIGKAIGIRDHHGVFADYLSIPIKSLHPVPETLDDYAAVFTEPLAAALQIQTQINIQPSDRVLVIGAGRLGLLVAQSLNTLDCELIVAARHNRQKELLDSWNIQSVKPKEMKPKSMHFVVDCSGSRSGFDLANEFVRPKGTIVIKSTFHGNTSFDFSPAVVDEVTIIGSRCGPFSQALKMLIDGRIDTAAMIDGEYSLNEGLSALEHAGQPGVLKILLRPGI